MNLSRLFLLALSAATTPVIVNAAKDNDKWNLKHGSSEKEGDVAFYEFNIELITYLVSGESTTTTDLTSRGADELVVSSALTVQVPEYMASDGGTRIYKYNFKYTNDLTSEVAFLTANSGENNYEIRKRVNSSSSKLQYFHNGVAFTKRDFAVVLRATASTSFIESVNAIVGSGALAGETYAQKYGFYEELSSITGYQ